MYVIRLRRFILFMASMVLFLFSFPLLTSAHAYIVKSSPSENQVLSKSPKKVTIQFDESIQTVFHTLKVTDMNGKQVDVGNSHISSKNSSIIECSLKPHLSEGTYRIEWKVVSSDGHPVDGVIPFGIGEGGSDQSKIKSTSQGYFPQLDLIIIRGIQFLSGAVFTGLIFLYLFVIKNNFYLPKMMENRYKKGIFYSFCLLFLTIAVNLPLQATIEADVNWSQVFNLQILSDMLMTSLYGKVWAIQIAVLILLFFTIRKGLEDFQNRQQYWQTSFILCCGLLLTKSFTSHALSTNYKIISIIMDVFHLVAASIWTGSLMGMILLLPLNKLEDYKSHFKQIIRDFFNWGVSLVLVLTITGLYSCFMYVSTIDSLLTTDYGRILLLKVILFIVMLLFAFINFLKGKTEKEKTWGGSLRSEVATGVVILVLAVILTNMPTAASAPGTFSKTINLNKTDRVTLKIDPKVVGANHFEVNFKDKSGRQLNSIQQITLSFTPPDKNLVVDTVHVPQVEVGKFYTQGMNINKVGRWKVHLHILTRELDAKDFDFSLTVGNR
jgi:copper transport protein